MKITGVIFMKRWIITTSLILAAAVISTGCSNPFRKKSQCESLCEQMHGECNVSCPADTFDPVCHERCDKYRDCRDTCDKPLFRGGAEEKGD